MLPLTMSFWQIAKLSMLNVNPILRLCDYDWMAACEVGRVGCEAVQDWSVRSCQQLSAKQMTFVLD